MTPPAHEAKHMLSFDVEEFFHVQSAAAGGLRPSDWDSFAHRLPRVVDRILADLSDHGARATFFVLGWVAQHEPHVVRRIAAAGHEIASHGMSHAMIDTLTPEQLRRELGDSKRILEDLCGRSVGGYRAATFSITHRTAWALDALVEAGYCYDSSIFPIRHDRYGVPEAPPRPHLATGPGGSLIAEIPPLTVRLLGHNLPVGGGGYLRLLPVRLLAAAIASAQRRGQPAMIYMHPWEFDPQHPLLPMTPLHRFRHRVNLARTRSKLLHLLQTFRFTSVEQYLIENPFRTREAFRYG